MTVEEFITNSQNINYKKFDEVTKYFIEQDLIKFAQYHVDKCLESASKAARIIDDPDSYTGNTGSEYPPDQIVDKESILNAYHKENIQ